MKSTLGGGCCMFTSVCKYPFRGGVIMFDRFSRGREGGGLSDKDN